MSRFHRKLAGLFLIGTMGMGPLAASAAGLDRNSMPPPTAYMPPAIYVDQNTWQDLSAGLDGYGWGSGGTLIRFDFQNDSMGYAPKTDFQTDRLNSGVTSTTGQRVWFNSIPGNATYAFGQFMFHGFDGKGGAGIGIEYKISPAWSAMLDLAAVPAIDSSGTRAETTGNGLAPRTGSAPRPNALSRIGLKYRFEGPGDPLE